MEKEEIYRTIPHRPPFLFIDTVEEIREDGAVAKRKICAEEPQFEGHYPGNPIMPGVLLCEAVFQTAAVCMSKNLEKQGKSIGEMTPVLSKIGEARFKQMVKPGDEITIEANLVETVSKFYFFKGTIRNEEGKLVLSLECALALIEEKK